MTVRPGALVAVCLLVAACGGSTGDDPAAPANPAWILIETPVPDEDGYCRSRCASAFLSGTASISETWSHCCGGTAREMTGVTVTWANAANGQSGEASQTVQICYLFGTPWLCEHDWVASVPLVVGMNRVSVTATDLAGYARTASIDVILPAEPHRVAGGVRTQDGNPFLSASNVGAWLALDDGTGSVLTGTSGTDGLYALDCVQPGTYTLTPYVPGFAYPFVPASRAVAVGTDDVAGQDFVTTVHRVSGHVADSSGPYTSGYVTLTGIPGTLGRYTVTNGDYDFVVPDGDYRITVTCGGLPCGSVLPPAIDVTVAGADVLNLDFLVFP